MYIFEKIAKLYMEISGRKHYSKIPVFRISDDETEDIVTCRHTFIPIDSTRNILACSKCGYLITRKQLEKRRLKAKKEPIKRHIY